MIWQDSILKNKWHLNEESRPSWILSSWNRRKYWDNHNKDRERKRSKRKKTITRQMNGITWHKTSCVSEVDNPYGRDNMIQHRWISLKWRNDCICKLKGHTLNLVSAQRWNIIRMKISVCRHSIWIKQEAWKMKNHFCLTHFHNNHSYQKELRCVYRWFR